MRKVVAGLFTSIDGVVEGVDQWSLAYFTDEVMEEASKQTDQQDAVLLGRVSYQEWAAYWPTSTDEPFASYINNIPKYVVSSTLNQVEWKNSTLLKGDLTEEINKLKQQPGKDLGVAASPTLVESLVERDLLDELRLAVYPVIAGHGRRLFQGDIDTKPLKLLEQKVTSTGVLLLNYGRSYAVDSMNKLKG